MSIVTKLFLLLLFVPQLLFSKNNDSLKNSRENLTVKFFNADQFEYVDSVSYIQNTLYNFQNYLDRGHLGNNGLPFNNLYFHLSSNPNYLGFTYSKNNFSNYFLNPQKFNFYNTQTPYSDLFYILGSKKEQDFKMTFSYNVKKNWNLSADFQRIRSEGFYLRQNTNDNFIALSSNFKSLNNRYYFLGCIIYNTAKNSENGGIANDSIFLNSGITDKKLIDVNLTAARHTIINRSVYFKQYMNFGKESKDTALHNSIIPTSRLILTSLFDNTILKYEDENPTSGYYSNIYYDSTRTFDTTYTYKLENELTWKRVDNKKNRGFKDMFGFGLSIKHQLIKVVQRELFSVSGSNITQGLVNTAQEKIDTTFNNLIAGAEFYNTYSKNRLWWNLSAKYVLNGYNKADYYASALFQKAIKDSLNLLILKVDEKLQEPDYIYNHYISNHFKWNNSFEKMHISSLMLHFSMKKYNLMLGSNYTTYSNVLYFNDSANAKQFKGSIPVLGVYLKKDFVFYNWHLNNKVNFQSVPESSVIKLPEFVFEHSLYYENDLFKHAMRLQVGASVFLTSAYYANAFMPATSQFYLQNIKKYGNYPFIDFYICARIKTVRIFFKIDHLNSGLMGNNYILTPGYPINDRSFKLGVSWRFFD